ncbi:MAG: ABC transporter substrate-binding protein [Bacteroidota bacterium]
MRTRALLLLIICVVLCSCKKRQDLKTIKIGTFFNAIDYAPFYVAKQQGWFEQSDVLQGLNIEFFEYGARSEFSSEIQNKNLHLIFAAEPPIIITKAQGVNLKIAGLSCTLQQEILVQKNAPYNKVSEINKSNIAVLQSTSSHYGLLKIIKDYGVDSLVTIRTVSPLEAKNLFENENIDGWAVWPPFVEEQLILGNGKILEGGDATIQSVMAIPDFVINDYPKIATEFCHILEKSKEWILNHPQESKNIVSRAVGQEYDVVDLAWPKHNWSAVLNDKLISDIQNKSEFLANQGETRNNRIVKVANELIFSCQD